MQIYTLPNETIAQGDTLSMEFEFVDMSGLPINIADFEVYYILSPYGCEEDNALVLRMTNVNENTFKYELTTEDTSDLLGTYTAKIVLLHSEKYYKKARGILNVLKDSNGIEVTI
jgi:hypothetical protein